MRLHNHQGLLLTSAASPRALPVRNAPQPSELRGSCCECWPRLCRPSPPFTYPPGVTSPPLNLRMGGSNRDCAPRPTCRNPRALASTEIGKRPVAKAGHQVTLGQIILAAGLEKTEATCKTTTFQQLPLRMHAYVAIIRSTFSQDGSKWWKDPLLVLAGPLRISRTISRPP